ncbi:hypothetical protein FNV43_RR17970 [Rhamnella rubrinervis]|uniref:Cytochrome P450 n=1 Tax=Rhamnella rubrinervis TaxID=2594499 RepID=A0A8K0GSF4_9ROSA|nr:hypothetical protein FNV43_RR17970 [Rhamnella rubrinervis]
MEFPPWAFLALSCLFLAALSFVFKTFPVFGAGGSNKFPPGPKPWPIIGNLNQLLIGTVPHQTYHKLSQKYGPILQLKIGTVPVVIASSAETAKLFLKTHDHVFAFRPKLAAGKYTGRNYTSILWSPYGPHHLQWRKICQSELFAFKRLESYEYIRVEEIRAFISSLYASLGEPLVLKNQLYCFTIGLMNRIVLGKRYLTSDYSKHATSTVQLEEFRGMLNDFSKLNGAFYIGDWIPWLAFLDLHGCVRKMKALEEKFDHLFDFVYDGHKANREAAKSLEPRDMVGLLVELMDDPSLDVKPTYDSVKGFTQDLLVGGTETTSSTLEWAMSELIKNPRVIVKATEELGKVIGRERWVEEKDIPQLHYIEAIMKETLRKHPASAMIPPHAAVEDCNVAGYQIKKGSVVLINIWSIGRDPTLWDAPEEFCPERFLEGKLVNIDVKGQSFELIPFGSGRRMCPGYSLALKMLMCGLANMLHGFNWSLPCNMKIQDLSMEEDFGISTPRKVPLVAVLEPRLPRHLYQQP